MGKLKTTIVGASLIVGGALGVDGTFHTAYEAQVVRVIDGDTIRVNVQVAPGLVQQIDVRERDLDTPEKRRGGRGGAQCPEEVELGKKVSALVAEKLPVGTTIGVENVGLGKYAGRWVGDVRFKLDGEQVVDLGDWLIGQELAVSYDGGKKRKVWCPKDETRLVE